MCDSGPIIYKQELKCSICGKSPAATIDEFEPEDETYCRACAIRIFGLKLVIEMEGG